MGTAVGRLNQGTTLLWTEAYGDLTPTGRRVERLKDLFFAATLVLFAGGVAGFLSYDALARQTEMARALARLL